MTATSRDSTTAPTHTIGRVQIVYAVSGRSNAATLRAQLRAEGFHTMLIALTGNPIDAVLRTDPDVVVISYVTASFDLARLCRDLSAEISCRIVVVVIDPQPHGSELDDNLVIDTLDAGAHAVIAHTTSSRVLAARLRAAIRAHPKHRPHPSPRRDDG